MVAGGVLLFPTVPTETATDVDVDVCRAVMMELETLVDDVIPDVEVVDVDPLL